MSLYITINCHHGYLKRFRLTVCIAIFVASMTSCKKFVEIDPPITQPSASVVYSNNNTAVSVMTGIYTEFAKSSPTGGMSGFSVIGGVVADELKIFAPTDPILMSTYTNSLLATSNVPFWNRLYYYIYTCNSVLENLEISPAVSAEVKKQLRGEALFTRAFCYFYLVNFFGDVPLILTTDYRVSSSASRTERPKVWEQIISDLKEAQSLVNSSYVEADGITSKVATERLRPNKWAVTALLARAYLYTADWANAEQQTSSVISNSTVYILETDLNKVFAKGSKEALWQVQSVAANINTYDGNVMVLTNTPDYSSPVGLNDQLLNSFETNDSRKTKWVSSINDASGTTYFFANKYKVKTAATISEYLTPFRLAEVYLIRAEARAKQGKIDEAKADLNIIRSRAGLPPTIAISLDEVIAAIAKERRIELFTEWAHRWLDLKRTGKVNEVMSIVTPLKGGVWNANWQWFPIPYNSAILTNPNIAQNEGY